MAKCQRAASPTPLHPPLRGIKPDAAQDPTQQINLPTAYLKVKTARSLNKFPNL